MLSVSLDSSFHQAILRNLTPVITCKEFKDAFCVFRLELPSSHSSSMTHQKILQTVTLRPALQFSEVLPDVVTVLLFCEFSNQIKVYKSQ